MPIYIDEKCMIDIYIQKILFEDMKFYNRFGYSVNADLKEPKIGICVTFFAYEKNYLKSDTRRNIKEVINKIEATLGLKHPITNFSDIEINNEPWSQYKYYRACELVYVVSKNFLDQIYALSKIQNTIHLDTFRG